MSTPVAPNLRRTGLFTDAPSAGSTKNTRAPPAGDAAAAAGGVAAGADSAGLAGSEELHAANATALARAANPAKDLRMFMVRLLESTSEGMNKKSAHSCPGDERHARRAVPSL